MPSSRLQASRRRAPVAPCRAEKDSSCYVISLRALPLGSAKVPPRKVWKLARSARNCQSRLSGAMAAACVAGPPTRRNYPGPTRHIPLIACSQIAVS